jgi:hypothetical protein
MVPMSLPHSSKESSSPYFLRSQHHKRDESESLFTSAHIRRSFASHAALQAFLRAVIEDLSITTLRYTRVGGYSCRTTLKRELLIWISPLYLMKPSFRNLFMKKFTRERVVPIISASIS